MILIILKNVMVFIWNDAELNALSNEDKLNLKYFQRHVYSGQILDHKDTYKLYMIFYKIFAYSYLQYLQILLEFALQRLA